MLGKKILLSHILCSKNLERYFQSKDFWVKYDVDITQVNEGILTIPVVLNIIGVAYVTGADIFVKALDSSFLTSLSKIQVILKKFYPRFPFSTKVYVENVVFNKVDSDNYGLLFSGGIDSMTSYIQHKSKKPNLIMIWGADISLSRKNFWRKLKTLYEKFSEREGVKINFLKSNIQEFLNVYRLDIEFSRYLESAAWWDAIQQTIFSVGICAPLTITNNIGFLLHASTFTRNYKYPQFSHPVIESKLSWAGVRVIDDGWEMSRQEKISQVLKQYLTDNNQNFPLRVCFLPYQRLNCSRCEKCYRTIIGLVIENIDPNRCGFHITSDFFDNLKNYVMKTRILITRENINYLWNDIKSHIPENGFFNFEKSKEFFDWFKSYDLSLKKHRNINLLWFLFRLYTKLPYRLQTAMERLQFLFGSIKLNFSIV